VLELSFRPDRAAPEPIYRQLETYLRGLIGTGRLLPGQKLPATRELALALSLGRNTVSQAYETLTEAGYATSHVGQGTFVMRPVQADGAAPVESTGRGFVWDSLFAAPARLRLAGPWNAPRGPVRFDLRPGQVESSSLPVAALRRAFQRATRDLSGLANLLDPAGYGPLRGEIARSLLGRGIVCEPRDVLVVQGAQQALDLVARVLLDPGDAVAVEQPGYFGAFVAFQSRGARLVGVGVDAEGLRTDELARVLRARRVKLVYTTPAVQCPTGVALSEARRERLLALADEHQTPVLEDDYDCQLRLGGRSAPALKSIDPAGQVIHLGTFSKALFPGLRLGYVVAARPLLSRLAAAQLVSAFGSSSLVQALLFELMQAGALERHVRRMRRIYAERLEGLLGTLREELPDLELVSPAGGTSLWLTLPEDVDAEAVHEQARARGLAYGRGEEFHLDGGGVRSLYLSYAVHSPEELCQAARLLADDIRSATAPASRRVEGGS
jgi:GntR family transcriptional regulator/MocR family aminotransferase